jgi:hypothetical protein
MAVLIGAIFAGVILLIVVGWYFSPNQKIWRALRQAPVIPIRDVPEGQPARITGQVHLWGQPLYGPLTGRPCAYYEVTVHQYRSRGRSGSWVQILKEVYGVPFIVHDGTGVAIVDPGQAKVALNMDSNSRSGTFDDATPAESALLQRHGIQSQGWVFNKKLRYSEGVIEPGETVSALGQGVREPDPDAGGQAMMYREGAPTRLRMSGNAHVPLFLTDRTDKV